MLQTFTKISGSKFKGFPVFLAKNFSTDNGKPTNPFPVKSIDLPEKQPTYEHKVNYNFEQYRKYARDYKKALEIKQKAEDIELKIKTRELIPRRKRRIYNAPKYDTNIENYDAWRVYDRELSRASEFSLPVACKVALAPKFVRLAFGEGSVPMGSHRATSEYNFEDQNLDLFILYDYAATTAYWGPNKENYDYENQEHLHPRLRIKKYPTTEEFWASEEEFNFRIVCSDYAEFRKFKKWVIAKVESVKGKESYEEAVKRSYGEFETYDNYDKKYELRRDPAVFKFNRSYFLDAGEKLERKSKYQEKLVPAKQMDDKYKIDYNAGNQNAGNEGPGEGPSATFIPK
jgi:hypothetical protein